MNENIDLTKILKNCPKGTKLYTPIWGEVVFIKVEEYKSCLYPICIDANTSRSYTCLSKDGRYLINREETECILFPSKDQRDWSKFTAPWYKKERFDPKTLKPFDKVLVKNGLDMWRCDIFSSYVGTYACPNVCIGGFYLYCIPYNDETKHLVGTTQDATQHYRYWED